MGGADGRRSGPGRARARTRGGRAGACGRGDARCRARTRLAGQQPRRAQPRSARRRRRSLGRCAVAALAGAAGGLARRAADRRSLRGSVRRACRGTRAAEGAPRPVHPSRPSGRARSGRSRRRHWCASACRRRAPGSPTRAMPSPAAIRFCSGPCSPSSSPTAHARTTRPPRGSGRSAPSRSGASSNASSRDCPRERATLARALAVPRARLDAAPRGRACAARRRRRGPRRRHACARPGCSRTGPG